MPSLKMNGVTAVVDSAVIADHMVSDIFTIASYVYRNAEITDSWGRIAGGGFNINPDGTVGMWYSTGDEANWFGTVSVATVPLNSWTHIAVTRTIGEVILYIDGVAVETTHPGGDMASDSTIDTSWFDNFPIASDGGGDKRLNANLSDFQFHTGVMSAQEINRLADPPALVVQYPLNETSGDVAADGSGNGFDLALGNNDIANWETIDEMPSLKMNGVTAVMDPAVIADHLVSDNFTIASYVYRNAEITDSWGRIAGGGFNIYPDGTMGMWYSTGDEANWFGTVSVATVPLNSWTHIAVTRSIGEVVLYIDGVAVETVHPGGDMANDSTIDTSWFDNFPIASDGNGDKRLNANLSDFRFYTGILSAQEINNIVNPSDLVLHHLFDETSGNTAADASGNGFDLALENNEDANWEKIGVLPSLKMNTVTAVVDSTVIADHLVSDNFTIAAYIYRNEAIADSWGRIAGGGYNINPDGTLALWYSTGDGDNWFGTVSVPAIPLNKWTHVAVTRSIGEVILYIDGVAIEVTHPGSPMEDDAEIDTWWFDNFPIASDGAGDKKLNANVSDFRFYGGVLSDVQIKELIKDLIPNSLVAHYRFDEAAGTLATDASGSGLDVPLLNTDDSVWGDGVVKGSLTLNGTDQYGALADNVGGDVFALQAFTISSYIKHDASMDKWGEWIFGYGDNYGLYWNNEGEGLTCYIYHTGGDWQGATYSDINLLDGYWHHVAGTWDSTTRAINLYIDGAMVKSDTMPGVIDWAMGDGAYIGNMNAEDRSWEGSLDELRIHRVALSESEIAQFVVSRYTLTTSVTGNGTVSPASGMFYNGEVLSLLATPDDGWAFKEWDPFAGSVGGTVNPATLTVAGNVTAAAVFEEVLGIDQVLSTASFKAYPNPFSDRLNIRYELTEEAKIKLTVFDLLGKEVSVLLNQTEQAGSYTLTWDGSDASNGVYYLQIRVDADVKIQKIIINR